jgi:hypothetical protein
MRVLSELQYHLEMESALRKTFIHDDPFDKPLAENVSSRRLLFDYHYQITPPLSDAVIEAALRIGDTGLYISSLWRPPGTPSPEPWHWHLSFDEFSKAYVGYDELGEFVEYNLSNIFLAEHVLYSPQGKWGIMISHERFGFLGGEDEFVKEVVKIFPQIDTQVFDYLRYLLCKIESYKEDGWVTSDSLPKTYSWLPNVVSNVYGEKVANKMLQESGIFIEQ